VIPQWYPRILIRATDVHPANILEKYKGNVSSSFSCGRMEATLLVLVCVGFCAKELRTRKHPTQIALRSPELRATAKIRGLVRGVHALRQTYSS